MSTITKITTQKKRKQRYNIFIDGKYAFAVDEKVLVEYKLAKGLKLEANEIIELLDAESLQASYVTAIHFLSFRQRSKTEIERHLSKKEIEPDHIEIVMNRLENEKLLNDLEFAKSFVQERIRQKKKGPRVIISELFEKGISKENIDEAIKLMTFNDQFEIALASAQKRADRPKKESVQKQKEQVRTLLMRNGFDNDVISEVMQEVIIEQDEESEWEAVKHHGERMYRRYAKKSSGSELRQKLMSALYTRGFKSEQINKFVDEILNNEE